MGSSTRALAEEHWVSAGNLVREPGSRIQVGAGHDKDALAVRPWVWLCSKVKQRGANRKA